MKIFIVFLFLFPLILSFGQLNAFLSCPEKIASSLIGDCQKRLHEHFDVVNNAEADMNKSAPSIFRCCYFAEYIHCITEEARPECGDNVANLVENVVMDKFKNILRKCTDTSYYSATCIFVIWFNLIIVGSILLGILLIGCCIGVWCCR